MIEPGYAPQHWLIVQFQPADQDDYELHYGASAPPTPAVGQKITLAMPAHPDSDDMRKRRETAESTWRVLGVRLEYGEQMRGQGHWQAYSQTIVTVEPWE